MLFILIFRIYHQLEDSFDEIVNPRKRRSGSIPSANVAPTCSKATLSVAASVNSDRSLPEEKNQQQPEGEKPYCKRVSYYGFALFRYS